MYRLKFLMVMLFVAVTASCARVDRVPAPPVPPQSPVVQEDLGQQAARHLTERYADTRANCGVPSQPSFLCNGVMIRGTASNPTFHVWENSAASIAKGGVSFAYLRADSRFRQIAGYNNGYILTAYFFAAGKLHPEVLCFFPINAVTASRSDKGCGKSPNYALSGPCYLNAVTTAQQWWSHYSANTSGRASGQCGFDVTDARNSLAGPAFAAGIDAMSLLGAESYNTQNEFVLAVWGSGLGKTLPLEAFFYLSGSAAGLVDAQRNQRDLNTTDGVLIPIIKVTLPASQGGTASFAYSASDQALPMPPVAMTNSLTARQ